jgi:hypothetical protein
LLTGIRLQADENLGGPVGGAFFKRFFCLLARWSWVDVI